MPFPVRLMHMWLGVVTLSAALHAFALHTAPVDLIGVPTFASLFIVTMSAFGVWVSLRHRSPSGRVRGIVGLCVVPVLYAVPIVLFGVPPGKERALLWWPLFNSIGYLICVLTLVTTRSVNFYAEADSGAATS